MMIARWGGVISMMVWTYAYESYALDPVVVGHGWSL
jgi:hypothetical protein